MKNSECEISLTAAAGQITFVSYNLLGGSRESQLGSPTEPARAVYWLKFYTLLCFCHLTTPIILPTIPRLGNQFK